VLHLSSSPSVASSWCVLLAPRPGPFESETSPPSPLVARAARAHMERAKQSAARSCPDVLALAPVVN
jgi:hypothetical protein